MRILIADDERAARQRILTLLKDEPDVEVAGECANGEEVVASLRQREADLLFLDIQMPGLDGFEALAALQGGALPLVVFVTAYDQHAVRAFEFHAFDYLLKPFDPERLRQTLQRARGRRESQRQEEQQRRLVGLLEELRGRGGGRGRFAIKTSGRIFFVRAEQVDFIEAEHNYVRLHVGSDSHLLREKLSTLEAELDRQRFRRIHRSVIVNIDRIRELQPWFRGDYVVVLQDGRKLTMSRTFREGLRDLFE